MRVLLCGLLVAGASAASVYPKTYPFADESVKPPDLPDKGEAFDNDNWDDPSNPGGYFLKFLNCDPYSPDRPPYSDSSLANTVPESYQETKPAGFPECRLQAYFFRSILGSAAESYAYNCTKMLETPETTAAISEAANWNNLIAGEEACVKGECCSFMDGVVIEQFGRHVPFMEVMGEHYTQGLCPTLPPEEVFCPYTTIPFYCAEYYVGYTNDRPVTYACYDVAWRWYAECPVFQSTRLILEISFEAGKWEAPQYLEDLAYDQLIVLEPIFKLPDRVCHPYSYYHPQDASESPGSSSAGITAGFFLPAVLAVSALN